MKFANLSLFKILLAVFCLSGCDILLIKAQLPKHHVADKVYNEELKVNDVVFSSNENKKICIVFSGGRISRFASEYKKYDGARQILILEKSDDGEMLSYVDPTLIGFLLNDSLCLNNGEELIVKRVIGKGILLGFKNNYERGVM